MYVADHIIQSITDPEDRKLVFKDTETGDTEQIQLPKIGYDVVWFDKKLYDCWGRELVIDPQIKRIIRDTGMGWTERYTTEQSPIFLVEKNSGNYAFAAATYVRANNPRETTPFNPYEYPLTDGTVGHAELRCVGKTYSSVETEFFKDTPLGEAFAALGLEIWLARVAGKNEAILLHHPYRRVGHDIWHRYDDEKCAYGNAHTTLLDPQLSPEGDRLTGKIRAQKYVGRPYVDYRLTNILLSVELTTDGLRAQYGQLYNKPDHDDCFYIMFSLPMKLLAEEPNPSSDAPTAAKAG